MVSANFVFLHCLFWMTFVFDHKIKKKTASCKVYAKDKAPNKISHYIPSPLQSGHSPIASESHEQAFGDSPQTSQICPVPSHRKHLLPIFIDIFSFSSSGKCNLALEHKYSRSMALADSIPYRLNADYKPSVFSFNLCKTVDFRFLTMSLKKF